MKKFITIALVILALAAMALESHVVEETPEANFGYDGPPSPEQRKELYGDDSTDQSLKSAEPQLFEQN